MRGCAFFIGSRLALAILSVTLFAVSSWAAVSEKVLHNFGSGNNGWYPNGVIWDVGGDFSGSTYRGGNHDYYGIIFEITPSQRVTGKCRAPEDSANEK